MALGSKNVPLGSKEVALARKCQYKEETSGIEKQGSHAMYTYKEETSGIEKQGSHVMYTYKEVTSGIEKQGSHVMYMWHIREETSGEH